MWWEKLETKINDILSNNKNPKETENRSERDMLEEILELSRLGVKGRRPNRYDISPDVLMDLLEAITELQRIGEMEGSKRMHIASRRLERPIEYLCRHSEFPEIYEKYRMMKRHKMHRIMDEDECDSEKS